MTNFRTQKVRIGDYPSGGGQRGGEKGLAPLEGVFGAGGDDGDPDQQGEQANLERGKRGGQRCIDFEDHREARGDKRAAGEIRPEEMPWQPARNQRGGKAKVEQMRQAEKDQCDAVEDSGDAQTFLACGKAEVLAVPVGGEPDIEHPGGRQRRHDFGDWPPGSQDEGRQDAGQSNEEQPKQEIAEQHTRSNGGGAPPEQAETADKGDERTEIGESGRALWDRSPERHEMGFDEAHASQGDEHHRKEGMTDACNAHLLFSGGDSIHRLQPPHVCQMATNERNNITGETKRNGEEEELRNAGHSGEWRSLGWRNCGVCALDAAPRFCEFTGAGIRGEGWSEKW
jgi:hypothetical protein